MKWETLFRRITGIVLVGLILFSGQVWAQAERSDRQQLRTDKKQIFKNESVIRKPEDISRETGIAINWRALKLTPEQQAQIQQLRRDFQINTAKVRKELEFAQQDLWDEMLETPVDRDKIDSALKEVSRLKQEISESALRNLLAIRELLTPAQREQLANSQYKLPAELRAFKLTQEQHSQIRELMKDSLKKNRTIFAEVRELKEELRENLISADEVDQEELSQLQASITEKELALEQARVENLLKIRDVLTPEQREKFQKSAVRKQKRVPTTSQ